MTVKKDYVFEMEGKLYLSNSTTHRLGVRIIDLKTGSAFETSNKEILKIVQRRINVTLKTSVGKRRTRICV